MKDVIDELMDVLDRKETATVADWIHAVEDGISEIEAERATVNSLLLRIHDIRVAAKLPESTMLSEIPAAIAAKFSDGGDWGDV